MEQDEEVICTISKDKKSYINQYLAIQKERTKQIVKTNDEHG